MEAKKYCRTTGEPCSLCADSCEIASKLEIIKSLSDDANRQEAISTQKFLLQISGHSETQILSFVRIANRINQPIPDSDLKVFADFIDKLENNPGQ